MGHIDEPLDQIEAQDNDSALQVPAAALNVGALMLGLLNPIIGAGTAMAGVFVDFYSKTQVKDRAATVQDGMRKRLGALADDVQLIKKRVADPAARDAVVTACRLALNTADLEKARRFGQILGGTLTEEDPDWDEAGEFIRNLEEINDEDLGALHILWNMQRSAYRVAAGSRRRQMSTNANDFTQGWDRVLEAAERDGVSKDDWYSRCGRLSGFGLATLVQPNAGRQGPGEMCYRMTGRAVRLLGLLGRNIDPNAYPKTKYHKVHGERIVQNEDEERPLGDWSDQPN